MRFSKIVASVVFAGSLIGLAPAAHAQALNNVGFGYNLFHSTDNGDSTNLNGFFVDLSGQITPTQKALSWVGDFAWAKHGESQGGVDFSLKVTTVQAAVRYSFLQNMMYTPWVQAGGGIAHTSLDAGSFGSDSTNDGVFSLIGGVDFPFGMNGWSGRGAIGYARITGDDGGNALIVRVGVTKSFK